MPIQFFCLTGVHIGRPKGGVDGMKKIFELKKYSKRKTFPVVICNEKMQHACNASGETAF